LADKQTEQELKVDSDSKESNDNNVPHLDQTLRTVVMTRWSLSQACGRRGTTEILHAKMPYRGPTSGVTIPINTINSTAFDIFPVLFQMSC
jgi:hypothetical protein